MLHLKRFDLDYTTMQRKKLNDRVSFPQVLNMNHYMSPGSILTQGAVLQATQHQEVEQEQQNMEQEWENERWNTTDDYCIQHNVAGKPIFDDDDKSPMKCDPYVTQQTKHIHAQRRAEELSAQIEKFQSDGEFVYELYSIMIHAGSAFGGHYYAFIRSFENDSWFKFNDSSVSEIEVTDIETVYGGVMANSWGTSTYGANAYLLMYRKIDANSPNTVPIEAVPSTVHEQIAAKKAEKERKEAIRREELMTTKLRIWYAKQLKQVSIRKDKTILDLKQEVKEVFAEELSGVDEQDFRIRLYYQHADDYQDAYDGEHETQTLDELGITNTKHYVVETKQPSDSFDVYTKGDLCVRILPWTDEYELPSIDYSLQQIIEKNAKRLAISGDCSMVDFLHRLECKFGVPSERCRLLIKSALTTAFNITMVNTPANAGKTCRQARISSGSVIYLEESETPATLEDSKWYAFFQDDADRVTFPVINNIVEPPIEDPITVSRQMKLEALKHHLSQRISSPPNQFILRLGNASGTELCDLGKTVAQIGLTRVSRLHIYPGSPLSVDQIRINLRRYELKPKHKDLTVSSYQFEDIGTVIISKDSTIGELKNLAKEEFPEIFDPLQNVRIRSTNNEELNEILFNDKVLAKVYTYFQHEYTLGVQVLRTADEAIPKHRAIIVKQWFPSTWKISPPVEILIDPSSTCDTFNTLLSNAFSIDPANLEVMKIVAPGSFIRGDLAPQYTTRWHRLHGSTQICDSAPFFMKHHRDVYLVRDSNEIVRDMTEDEKQKWCKRSALTSTVSTPAERSVRITVKSAKTKTNEKP